MPNMKCYFAKAKFVERLLHLFALDLKSTPISFCRCPLHGLCRVYALAAGPNIYSTFVLQFLLIMMMLDPLLLIPCLEIRRFLGAIERRLRSVCAIPHPNGHCYETPILLPFYFLHVRSAVFNFVLSYTSEAKEEENICRC
jgi:hypothetical protein